jgi:hypothetical protein
VITGKKHDILLGVCANNAEIIFGFHCTMRDQFSGNFTPGVSLVLKMPCKWLKHQQQPPG